MQNTTEFHLMEILMTWRVWLPGNLSEAAPTSACSGMPIFTRSYFTLSPNLSTTLTLPTDEHPAWRIAGSSSDSWLDANFRDRDEMCFLDGTPVLTSRSTDGWSPCCARARSPASIPPMPALSWLQSNDRSLITGPTGHSFWGVLGKPWYTTLKAWLPLPAFQPRPPEWRTVNESQQKPPCDCPGLLGCVRETVTCGHNSR